MKIQLTKFIGCRENGSWRESHSIEMHILEKKKALKSIF